MLDEVVRNSWALVLLSAACATPPTVVPTGAVVVSAPRPSATEAPVPATVTDPIHVELFVMSKCPFGLPEENIFGELKRHLGSAIDLDIEYIGSEDASGLHSLHGADELAGDLYQVCSHHYASQWFETILCQNKFVLPDLNRKDITMGESWETCAYQSGVDTATIGKVAVCANSDEGKALLRDSFSRATAIGVRGSPSLYVEGKLDVGPRTALATARRICGARASELPPQCSDIGPAPQVNITVLSDSRDPDSRSERDFHQTIDNPVVTKVDYATPQGRALYASIAPITTLPAYIFDDTLTRDPDAAAQFHFSAGGHVVSGGTWNPTCVDDGGCKKSECAQLPICRAEKKQSLDVFVMSKCPFAAKGISNLAMVADNYKKHGTPLAVSVHFIGDVGTDKLTSMRGPAELDEDLRDVCAIAHYGAANKFLEYMACRDKDLKSDDWKACTGGQTGISAATIQKCAEGKEGHDLLTKSFQASSAAKIGASPTWLVNGKFLFMGLDAELIKTKVCEKNQSMKGCEVALPGPEPTKSTRQP